MEQTFSKSGLAAVLATTALLSACGGGGGGSDGSGGGDGGSTSQLQLDPDGYGERQAQLRTLEDYAAAAEVYSDTARVTQLVGEVESALGMSGSLSADDPTVQQAAVTSCENEGGTADVTTSDTSTRVVFDNCELTTTSVPNLLLNGSFSQDFSGSNDNQTVINRYNIRGENLDTGGPISIQGQESMRIVTSGSGQETVTLTSDRLEYLFEDNYVALLDSEVLEVEDSDSYSMDISATLIGSAIDGYLTMTTPEPVLWNFSETCAVEGAIRLEADGSVEVTYGVTTGTGDAVQVTFNDSTYQGFDTCNDGAPWYE